MTLEDFRTALNFVLSDKSDRQVGIIGGEPLLYSHIDEALRIALSDPRTEHVMIYHKRRGTGPPGAGDT